uniref:Uncharacterized protein n=1 Tax=Aegilops tauschii subsp. strangulata TaxID=200361 RepID=A0A453QUK3_AEGTS|nr:uncharacterized protein LOC109759069 [Aegilops tauschii subsp. strangulata]
MGGKAFHAHEFPEKPEGDGWVASGWGLLKAAVGKKVPEEADLHRRCDERIGMDGVKIPGIKWEKDRGVFAEVVILARAAPMMVQAATAKMVQAATAKMEEVAKNRRA